MKTELKSFICEGNNFPVIVLLKIGFTIMAACAIFLAIGVLKALPQEILFLLGAFTLIRLIIHSLPVCKATIYMNDSEKKNFEQANLDDLRIMLKKMKHEKDKTSLQISSPYSHFKAYEILKEKISLCRYEIKKRKWQRILGKNVA